LTTLAVASVIEDVTSALAQDEQRAVRGKLPTLACEHNVLQAWEGGRSTARFD
jgi:hypothetical protein